MGANAPSLDTPLVLIGHEGRRRVLLHADHGNKNVRYWRKADIPWLYSAGGGCYANPGSKIGGIFVGS
jgi:hypothetical protein